MTAVQGTAVDVRTEDGTADAYLVHPEEGGPRPAVLLFMDVAGFHGARLATDTPDSAHLLAGHITAELYFGHADDDPALPPEEIERLEAALTEAGVRHHCEVYPGAEHGFTQADTSSYQKEGDRRHWAAVLDLLDRTF
jgi:carboxymethylenebutenolidase